MFAPPARRWPVILLCLGVFLVPGLMISLKVPSVEVQLSLLVSELSWAQAHGGQVIGKVDLESLSVRSFDTIELPLTPEAPKERLTEPPANFCVSGTCNGRVSLKSAHAESGSKVALSGMVENVFLTNKAIVNKLLLALLAVILGAPGTVSARDIEKSHSTVVMVEGKLRGTTTFGAGIVVGSSPAGIIYIATANHVVRQGRSTEATDIQVKFKFLPGEKFPATLLKNRDKELDFAVLSIRSSGDIPEGQINYNVLGNTVSLKRGSDVYPLGNPQSVAWGVSIRPEKVANKKRTQIAFQSSYIQKGHSGGALLDGCGDIVGLITRDGPPNGLAVPIELVLQSLRGWNFPIKLQATGGCAGSTQVGANQATAPAGQTSTAGPAFPVNNNPASAIKLVNGKSRKFSIEQPGGYGFFVYTPAYSSKHKISALSEPNRVDVGWQLYKDRELTQLIVECDNDYPLRGTEPCSVNLQGGQPYYMVVANLTGDETGEPSEAVAFTIEISP